ncbi:MAG: hypothetical protein IBJ18_12240 [Phycisphaerales bacterium]|nr:hypothetical protein [Phycisphaerales bacterium]
MYDPQLSALDTIVDMIAKESVSLVNPHYGSVYTIDPESGDFVAIDQRDLLNRYRNKKHGFCTAWRDPDTCFDISWYFTKRGQSELWMNFVGWLDYPDLVKKVHDICLQVYFDTIKLDTRNTERWSSACFFIADAHYSEESKLRQYLMNDI